MENSEFASRAGRVSRVRSSVFASISVFVLTVLGVIGHARPAQAYAWMIRHRLAECGSCHVDPMGGETLTGMGRAMSQVALSMPWSDNPPTRMALFALGIEEPEDVRLGGSFRGMSIHNFNTSTTRAFPMQADLYGAIYAGRFVAALSLGVARASERYEHASKARLVGSTEEDAVILVSRHHWLGYRLRDDLMLRAGRLNLPFGIRMPEHTMWVRSETGTDRESDQQHGVSVVYARGRIRGELMASVGNFQAGNEALSERGYSGYAEYLAADRFAVGVSSLFLGSSRELAVDRGWVFRQAHGVTLRYSPFQPLVILAEANALKRSGAGVGYVGMATLDFEPIQGLHLATTGEVLDRGRRSSGDQVGNGEPRVGAWLTANWFFAAHFDLRVDLVLRQNRAEMLQAQLHFYL